METASHNHHRLFFKCTTSLPNNHHRFTPAPNKNRSKFYENGSSSSIQICLAAMRDLTFRRISSSSPHSLLNNINAIFQSSTSFFSDVTVTSEHQQKDMATTINKKPRQESTTKDITSNNKQEKELPPPPPPPPPEKPEPGDCCGSGCVRCVWDVYYEELEEYNKLYKSNSSSSDSNPS